VYFEGGSFHFDEDGDGVACCPGDKEELLRVAAWLRADPNLCRKGCCAMNLKTLMEDCYCTHMNQCAHASEERFLEHFNNDIAKSEPQEDEDGIPFLYSEDNNKNNVVDDGGDRPSSPSFTENKPALPVPDGPDGAKFYGQSLEGGVLGSFNSYFYPHRIYTLAQTDFRMWLHTDPILCRKPCCHDVSAAEPAVRAGIPSCRCRHRDRCVHAALQSFDRRQLERAEEKERDERRAAEQPDPAAAAQPTRRGYLAPGDEEDYEYWQVMNRRMEAWQEETRTTLPEIVEDGDVEKLEALMWSPYMWEAYVRLCRREGVDPGEWPRQTWHLRQDQRDAERQAEREAEWQAEREAEREAERQAERYERLWFGHPSPPDRADG
jgi:hypothetical protein